MDIKYLNYIFNEIIDCSDKKFIGVKKQNKFKITKLQNNFFKIKITDKFGFINYENMILCNDIESAINFAIIGSNIYNIKQI